MTLTQVLVTALAFLVAGVEEQVRSLAMLWGGHPRFIQVDAFERLDEKVQLVRQLIS